MPLKFDLAKMADGECEESPESAPSPGFAGAVVRGFDPRTTDDTTLRLYFDSSEGGRAQVANVGFSAHRDEAYVEYKNPPGTYEPSFTCYKQVCL